MDEIRRLQEFLEICRARMIDSTRRFQVANANLQRAQQEFAAAQAEHNNWQGVIQAETRRLNLLQQAAQANQAVLPMAHPPHPQVTTAPVTSSNQQAPASKPHGMEIQPSAEVNKTELVRELLSQHPEGMTPGELWDQLKNQIGRDYLYSILKRLKDTDQVIYQRRRKKYSLRVVAKPEEAGKETISKDQAVVH